MPGGLRTIVFLAGMVVVLLAATLAVVAQLPPLPAAVVPALAVGFVWFAWDRPREIRNARRARGLCVHCGYDLTANVTGVCPECGTECGKHVAKERTDATA